MNGHRSWFAGSLRRINSKDNIISDCLHVEWGWEWNEIREPRLHSAKKVFRAVYTVEV